MMDGIAILVVAAAIYFLPTIVAHNRQVPSIGSVAVVNVFLGWTLIGWVVALAMAARTIPQAHLELVESQRQARMAVKQAQWEQKQQRTLAELDARPRKTIRLGGRDLPDHRRDDEPPAKGPVIRRSY